MSFSQPSAGGDQFDAKDHNGRLLLVFPKSFAAETPTAHGISPSADVDIVVVDSVGADGRPQYFQNARLFGNLAKSVSRDLGGQVLGRLGQVPTQRGNPAWVLQNYTDADAALATPALTAYQQGQFKQAENPMQGQAPQPGAPAQQFGQQPPQQQYQAPPAAAPAQQWQAPPAAAPAPPQQQQWQAPAAAPAPAGPPAAPAPAPAPAGAPIDPNLVAFLASKGINGPFPDQATAEAIANSIPQ